MTNSNTTQNENTNTNPEKTTTKKKIEKDVTDRGLKAALIANSIKKQSEILKNNSTTTK